MKFMSKVAELDRTISVTSVLVRNQAGVQLLSSRLREQIFSKSKFTPPSATAIEISAQHLANSGLAGAANTEVPDINFGLPSLEGKDIEEHFHNIGLHNVEAYLRMAQDFAKAQLPPMPTLWSRNSGWTRYDEDGSYYPVESPPSAALVFDVETMYGYSEFAVMATAADSRAWYSWLSPWLLGEVAEDDYTHLIPLPARDGSQPRLIIGHNVGYDRARIADEYSIERSGNRFLDTMSLHIAVHGLSNPQRPAWMLHRKTKSGDTANFHDVESETLQPVDLGSSKLMWQDVSSTNSLAEVAQLHLGIKVNKDLRNSFGPGATRESVLEGFDDLMTYCANDVRVTHGVYAALLPHFLQLCPSPVTFAGLLHMGIPFLPVDNTWPEFIANADKKYEELLTAVNGRLAELANEARKLIYQSASNGLFPYEQDPWLKQLEWSPKKARKVTLSQDSDSNLQGEDGSISYVPTWFASLPQDEDSSVPLLSYSSKIAPLLLKVSYNERPVTLDSKSGWSYIQNSGKIEPILIGKTKSRKKLIGVKLLAKVEELSSPYPEFKDSLNQTEGWQERLEALLNKIAIGVHKMEDGEWKDDPWLSQLDWAPTKSKKSSKSSVSAVEADLTWPKWYWDLFKSPPRGSGQAAKLHLTVRSRVAPLLFKCRWREHPLFHSHQHGWTFRVEPDLVAAELQFEGNQNASEDGPLDFIFPELGPRNKSRAAKSTKSVHYPAKPKSSGKPPPFWTHLKPLAFETPNDLQLADDIARGYRFFKVPHVDGDDLNVGNPLSKAFVAAFEDGRLTAEFAGAKEALAMNAQCSYWVSMRERCMQQFVMWQSKEHNFGLLPLPTDGHLPSQATPAHEVDPPKRLGLILPQVVTMGTVTRRAVEKTWLTASNAKKNRVGSEVKAMVRAPPGYAIVGADVDSEELWVASVMGDAQFGIHGATALGWQTLEGTKSAGTDMHSATAAKIGVSRDEAKVFNYSRIYGAGVKHATHLLLKANATLASDQASDRAKALYAATKGKRAPRGAFGRQFWYGGSESFVFNKLESIAMSDDPRTPTLGCGITQALAKKRLPASERSAAGESFMPSRINWVVQSSGVDYLHLLIVSMEYLIKKYQIKARYMISVHDEIRYLVTDEDKYRAALALQISNLWTRAIFAYRLEMDDLPQVSSPLLNFDISLISSQSCAFFSAVDVDFVFRKEVNMPCITPSHPIAIPPGQSLDIAQTLKVTGGSLNLDGHSMSLDPPLQGTISTDLAHLPLFQPHRITNDAYLAAQSSTSPQQVLTWWVSISWDS